MHEPDGRAPPNLQGSFPAARRSLPAAEAVLTALFQAHKGGALADLLRRHPRLAHWLERRYLPPVRGTVGDGYTTAQAVGLVLRWTVAQLRPDGMGHLEGLNREAWLDRTSWRPMLALACHYGLLPVPDFPDRYRRRPDESAADNLCGLWNVGPSTFYRYLDKGKRLATELLVGKGLTGARALSLRRALQPEVYARLQLEGEADRIGWHRAQAQAAAARGDCKSTLWHLRQALDHAGFVRALRRFRIELAKDEEADALIEELVREAPDPRTEFDLRLAHATLWSVRNAEARALEAFERARQLAGQHEDPLLLGRAYGWVGKFHESRDMDRAMACLEDSAEFLRQALTQAEGQPAGEVTEEYLSALQRLAWHYVQRNDARARAVLERSDLLRGSMAVSPEVNALIEQAWGEYWRRSGELRRAAEHHLRALNVFERLADARQMLSTFNNLSLIYCEAKDFDRAVEYGRKVLAKAEQTAVEPYLVVSVLLNLGIAYFWQERYDEAISHYERGLQQAQGADMRVAANRAHYNLAEAYYKRFQRSADPRDERRGDEHAAALKALPSESDPGHLEATRALKAEILGPHEGFVHDRLLPEEVAAHAHEMAQVKEQRRVLALPAPPAVHVRARLAIAKAYLEMSTKERDAALSLMHKHGLGEAFTTELDDLRATFNRELTREQQLLDRWKQSIGDLLTDGRRAALIDRLVRGEPISKSTYAELCSVGLATASKHLGLLAERGLLVQVGKGPKTRYLLPPQGA
jgi:tetratricopeptide (TPR) repeat protein